MNVEKCLKYNSRESDSKSTEDIPTKMYQCIQCICEKEGFSEYELEKKCLTGVDNFFSIIYKIDVKGKTKVQEKEINLFVKHVVLTEMYAVEHMFDTELFAYTDMFQKFQELQAEANINVEERYKTIKVYQESSSEVIILENLSKKGFVTNPRTKVASLQFFQLAVKELAKFHALSFVLKETQPRYFNEKIKSMKYAPLLKDSWVYVVENGRKASVQAVDEIYKDKVEKAYDLIIEKIYEYYTDENIKICLCHGDYRSCNILMKLNENGIEDIVPVDYQMMYYGNPVIDFLYFIFISTDGKFRKAHLSTLKDLYYETLSNFLTYFQMDANLLFPKEEYERVYKKKFDFGLMIAAYLLPLILSSGNHVPDVTCEEVHITVDDTFKHRLQEIIDEYVELGFI